MKILKVLGGVFAGYIVCLLFVSVAGIFAAIVMPRFVSQKTATCGTLSVAPPAAIDASQQWGPVAEVYVQDPSGLISVHAAHGMGLGAMEIWVMLGIAAAFVGVLVAAIVVFVLIVRASRRGRAEAPVADETRLIQEIYRGLSGLEQRVMALETLLLETQRRARA